MAEVNKEPAPAPSRGAKASTAKPGTLEVTIGTMIETPRAALRAGEIAEVADFFSFGTNDLTQMTFGFSRDDVEGRMMDAYLELGLLPRNPFEVVDSDGVGELVRLGTERGRATRPALKVGVCGEHGGDPESIGLFYDAGLDYVSCSPFRVPVARLAAAQAVLADERRSRGGAPEQVAVLAPAGQSEAPQRDEGPDGLDDAEGPGARQEAVGAREGAAEGEGQDEAPAASSRAYMPIMKVRAQTP